MTWLVLVWLSCCTLLAAPRLSDERAVFETNFGSIVVGFFPDLAPKHVAQVLRLIRLGVYDDSDIFRVEAGFVAQVENFTMRKVALPENVRSQIPKLRGEFNAEPHTRGILSMARFDDPDSAESSFSFVLGDAPHLNGVYTVFGKVVEGFETLASIERLTVDSSKRPTVPVKILRARMLGPNEHMPTAEPRQPASSTTYLVAALLVVLLVGGLFFSGKPSA